MTFFNVNNRILISFSLGNIRKIVSLMISFLDALSHLYKRMCSSVHWSVRRFGTPSLRPCFCIRFYNSIFYYFRDVNNLKFSVIVCTQNLYEKKVKYSNRNLMMNADFFIFMSSVADILTVKNRALQTFASESNIRNYRVFLKKVFNKRVCLFVQTTSRSF